MRQGAVPGVRGGVKRSSSLCCPLEEVNLLCKCSSTALLAAQQISYGGRGGGGRCPRQTDGHSRSSADAGVCVSRPICRNVAHAVALSSVRCLTGTGAGFVLDQPSDCSNCARAIHPRSTSVTHFTETLQRAFFQPRPGEAPWSQWDSSSIS